MAEGSAGVLALALERKGMGCCRAWACRGNWRTRTKWTRLNSKVSTTIPVNTSTY